MTTKLALTVISLNHCNTPSIEVRKLWRECFPDIPVPKSGADVIGLYMDDDHIMHTLVKAAIEVLTDKIEKLEVTPEG